MAKPAYILSIDQGTTSSRAILFDQAGHSIITAQQEFEQLFPESGWVEHRAEDIWETTLKVCTEVVAAAEQNNYNITALGITNQRETTLVWDRKTGKAIYNAIVWQDRRTAVRCEQLREAGHEIMVTNKTGLLLDPYFSATKLAWILDNVNGAREKAQSGELAFGTVDSFLLWRLTGGKSHATDASNASRTLLYNIHDNCWDQELLTLLQIPKSILPEVRDCAADFGRCDKQWLGKAYPIAGMAGDQQAAAFGQACFEPGMIKSTYGTGCFVLMNTGKHAVQSKNKLLTTIGYRLNGETSYAIEGSIFVAGAAVQWLRDGLGIIQSAAETEQLAASLNGNNGVYLVPAFTGLGAPHWDAFARGSLYGLTRSTGVAEIARATLEAVCYQTHDLFQAMASDGINPIQVRVDGGMVKNDWLTQFLSNILNIPVQRPRQTETTALGVAYLAGLQTGIYAGFEDLQNNWQQEAIFTPRLDEASRKSLLLGWQLAIKRTRSR